MIEIQGKYSVAKVMVPTEDDIEKYAYEQIKMICDNEVSKNANVVVMPDVHPGKVGPIGLTIEFDCKSFNRMLPALLGLDSGCGFTCVKLGKIRKDFQKLDSVIRDNIPVGMNIRNIPHQLTKDSSISEIFESLRCIDHIRKDHAILSLGTLGGGNHFIEIGVDEEDDAYLTIHSGSRGLGREVYDYYMNEGQKILKEKGEDIPYEMTYITDKLLYDYLHDMQVLSDYAVSNRWIIAYTIIKNMKYDIKSVTWSTHNGIETYLPINSPERSHITLRKGASPAYSGDNMVIIPVNMRDGIITGAAVGNKEWNYSAPHGSGRILSREAVKNSHTLSEFKKEMKGIYSPCISKETLDEAPFAYRDIEYVKKAIKDTIRIDKIIRPIYNYKGGSK